MRQSFGMRRVATVAMLATMVAVAPAGVRAQQAPQAPQSLQAAPAQQQKLRVALGRIVQRQLALTDAQAQQLVQVSGRYEQERRQLAQQERETRQLVREEMLNGDSANQDRVSRGIDRMLGIQRQRLDIVAREQKELAGFLTPVQRAKYLVLQDQLRKRLEEMRRQREFGGQPALGDAADRPLLRRRLQRRGLP